MNKKLYPIIITYTLDQDTPLNRDKIDKTIKALGNGNAIKIQSNVWYIKTPCTLNTVMLEVGKSSNPQKDSLFFAYTNKVDVRLVKVITLP